VDTAWFNARLEDGMKLIVVHKWVVDVSEFIQQHPGGDVFAVGEDNTMAYYNEHGCAPGILEKLAELTVRAACTAHHNSLREYAERKGSHPSRPLQHRLAHSCCLCAM
jgi:cytochrome b involved in lipid metabolism